MLIASVLTNALGIFVFLFIFWKRQKEDFSSEVIFRIATHILVGIAFGELIWLFFLKAFWIYLVFAGGMIGLFTAIYRLRTKFYEIFEAFVIASLPWLSLLFLLDSVAHSSLSSFLGFLAILIIIFISYWMDAHYKSFSWYRSGKIGFTGLVTLMLIFLARFSLAIFRIDMLSFVSKFEYILSGIGFLVCTILLVSLGRKKE